MNEEIKKLYEVLSSKGYYTKSFQDFESQWSSDDYKKKVFDVISKDKLYTKDYNSFLSKYGNVPVKKKDETTPSTSKQSPAQSPSATGQTPKETKPSASSGLLNQLSKASGVDKPIKGTIFDGYEKKEEPKQTTAGDSKFRLNEFGLWEENKDVYVQPLRTGAPNQDQFEVQKTTQWTEVSDPNKVEELNKKFLSNETSTEEGKLELARKNELLGINSKFVTKSEEDVVSALNKSSFANDFTFQESGIGNKIIVTTKDGLNSQAFYVGALGDDAPMYARKLRHFLESNRNTEQREQFAESIERSAENERALYSDAETRRLESMTEAEKIMIENGIDPTISGVSTRDVDMGILPLSYTPSTDKLIKQREDAVVDYKTQYSYLSSNLKGDFNEPEVKDALRASVGSMDDRVTANFNRNTSLFLEDVRKSVEISSKRISELNQEAYDIKLSIANNGAITDDQKQRLHEIQIERDVINENLEGLDFDIKQLEDLNIDMAEASGIIQAKKAEEGDFAGEMWNGLIRGAVSVPKLIGLIDKDQAEELIKAIGDPVTTEEWASSSDRTMLEKAMFGLSESFGTMAGSILAGPAAGVMSAVGFYSLGYHEMMDEMESIDGIPDGDKQFLAAIYGATSGMLERFGIMKAISDTPAGKKLPQMIMKRVFSSLPKNASPDVIELAIKSDIKKLIASKAINILGSGAVEFSTEAAQELDKVAVQELYDLALSNNYFDNGSAKDVALRVFEAGVLGAIGGGVMSTVAQSSRLVKESWKKNGMTNELASMIKAVSGDANFSSIQANYLKSQIISGKISPEEAKSAIESYNEIISTLNKIPEDVNDIPAAYDLIIEKQKLEKEIEGKDKALVANKIDRINAINEELTNISKQDAVQEQTTSEVPVQSETETGRTMEEGKPETEPQVVTEEGQKEVDYATSEVERVKALPIENEDGATMNLDGSKYENGGLVVPLASKNMKASELTREAIDQFVEENSASIGADNVKVGIYKFPNSDMVSIDLNIVSDRSMSEEALKVGRELGQKSLFDLDTGEYVETGADGLNPRTLTSAESLAVQKRLRKTTEYTASTPEIYAEKKKQHASDPRKLSIVKAAEKANRATPDTPIVLHETREEYLDAIANKTGNTREEIEKEESGNEVTYGSYITEDGEVHIDMTGADETTVYHEVFHDIFKKKGLNEATAKEMVSALKSVVKDKDMLSKMDKFAQQYAEGEQGEEFITELVATLASEAKTMDVNTLQKLINIINGIAEKLGVGPVLKQGASRQEVVDFLNRMSTDLREGRKIEGVSGKVEVSEDAVARKRRSVMNILTEDESTQISEEVVGSTKKGKNFSTLKVFQTKNGEEFIKFEGEVNQVNVRKEIPSSYITVASKIDLYNTAITKSADFSDVNRYNSENHKERLHENKTKIDREIESVKKEVSKIKAAKYKKKSDRDSKISNAMDKLKTLQSLKKSKSIAEMSSKIKDINNIAFKSSLHSKLIFNIGNNFERLTLKDLLEKSDSVYLSTKDVIKKNLKAVYNSVSPEIRSISKLWYDGANLISQNWASEYNLSLEQVSAIIATQSPQMPWFDNLHLAHVIMDTMSKSDQMIMTEELYSDYISKAKNYEAQMKYAPMVKRLIGTKLSDMSDYDAAIFIRLDYDANISRKAPIRIPSGTNVDVLQKSDSSFSGYDVIAKGVSVFRDGSDKNIDSKIGRANKVRNFYINIADPNNSRAVTIDTHAMAIALMKPLASNDFEVDFSPASFGFYADAYRELADELNIKARELQSITWEAARAIFPAKKKASPGYKEDISSIWDRYNNGDISLEELHSNIFNNSENPNITEWYNHIKELKDERKRKDVSGRITRKQRIVSIDRLGDLSGVNSGESRTRRRPINTDENTEINKASRKKRMTEPVPGNKLFNEPLKEATDIAKSYMNSVGIDYVEVSKISKLDESLSARIAKAYDAMNNDPSNPEVREAYEAMAKETLDQYEAITSQGYEVEINNSEPYSSSGDMINDLKENKRMKIFSTESGFGDEPITDAQREENILLRDSGKKDKNGQTLLINDIFRFVHDFFGHAKLGNGFGPVGEENAWRVHSVMYSDVAVKAMTSETRGQNSWVNFSGVNKEAFKKRDKARELRRQGKIEEADAMVNEVYDEMKFADQKMGILPAFAWEQGAPSRKKRISSPERSEAINKAQDKYKLSLKRGNTELQAIDAAIADLKKNEWYRLASDIERENAIRDLRKNLGLKEKTAPSVNKVTGKPKDKKVTVNERTALRDQIILEARAAREAVKAGKEERAGLADLIRTELGKVKGRIPGAKISSIINKALKMNLSNPVIADRFANYIYKLAKDAEYDNKLTQANKVRNSIKRKLKSKLFKQKNNVAMGTAFKKIDPRNVDDIDAYIEIAEKVNQSLSASVLRGSDVIYKVQAEQGEVNTYVEEQIKAQDKLYMDMLELQYPELFESGYLNTNMSVSEAMTWVNSLKEGGNEKVTDEQLKEIREKLVNDAEILSEYLKNTISKSEDEITGSEVVVDDRTKSDFSDLIKSNKSNMSISDLLKYIDVMQNALVNGEVGGVSAFAAELRGANNATELFKEVGKIDTSMLLQSWAASGTVLLNTALGGVKRTVKFMKASGLGLIRTGKTMAINIANKTADAYEAKFKNSKPNKQKFMSEYNVTERGVYAFVSRNVTGSDIEMANEFNRRLNLVRQTLSVMESDIADERMKQRAKSLREVVEKLGILEDDITIDIIESRVDKANIDAVQYWIDKWAENYDELAHVSSSIYNRELPADLNYNPDVMKRIMNVNNEDIIKMLEGYGNSAYGVYDTQSSSLTAANRPKVLPMTQEKTTFMYVDFEFDANVSRAFRDAMIDIKTAEGIRQWKGFSKSEGFRKMIPNEKNRNAVIESVNRFILKSRGADRVENVDQNVRALNRITNSIGKIGGSLLLSGVNQLFKQSISIMANTAVNSVMINKNGFSFGGFIAYKDAKTGQIKMKHNKSILFGMSKEFTEWMLENGVDIGLRGIESTGTIDVDNRFEKAAITGRLEDMLDNVGKVSEEYIKLFLVAPDKLVARSAFASYYMKHLVENGKNPVIDITKPMDEDAKLYAMNMVSKQQGESDSDLHSKIYSDNRAASKALLRIIAPLSSFVINKKTSILSDISTIRSNADNADKIIAMKSLAASTAESAIFTTVSIMWRYTIVNAIANYLTGYDDEDDDKEITKLVDYENKRRKALKMQPMTPDEEKDFRRTARIEMQTRRFWGEYSTNMAKDMIPVPPILDDMVLGFVDRVVLKNIQKNWTKSDEIKEAIKVENEIRNANKKNEMDSVEEDEFVAGWIEDKAMRLSIFDNTGLGGYSFAGEKVKSVVDIQKADVNGYITKDDGEKRWLLPNEKKAMETLANMVAYAPIAPSDLMSVAAKSYSKISKKSVTYDQYKRYGKIKEWYEVEPEGLEDMIRAGMTDKQIRTEVFLKTGIKANIKAGN